MGKIIIVLGSTGSGKSTSIKNLDPKKTIVANCILNKDLPFIGSRKLYNEANQNLIQIQSWEHAVQAVAYANESRPEVTTLVFDDMRYIMELEYFKRAKEAGYAKYTELGMHFQAVFDAAVRARTDLTVVAMLHDEDVTSNSTIVRKDVKLVGAMVKQHYDPIELVDICLYAKAEFGKEGKVTYGFYTHKVMVGGIELPCKSPEGMFTEDFIPNDLSLVLKRIQEFYN